MQVFFNKIQNYDNYPQQRPFPSFKMKMTELKGIDRFVAKSNKINPQPLKTLEDFQNYCKKLVDKIAKTDFGGRQQETQVQRKAMIDEWFNYVTKENDAYTGAMQYMILRAITSDLKPNEDTLPAILNKGVLANTVSEVQKTLESDPDKQFNFEKTYRNNLQKSMLQKETALDENLNGWIIIPSKEHDPENFEANVDKLKMLSHNNWCTKSYNAEPYLKDGDFHVYMEKGKPKVGVRFVGDEVKEIQGELNNSKIPFKYYDVITPYLKNFKLSYNAKSEVQTLNATKAKVDNILEQFPEGINNYPETKILKALGITYIEYSDGLLKINSYKANLGDYTLADLGIDENRLFKKIYYIDGDADFKDSNVTDLGALRRIQGDASFSNSRIANLGNLQYIGRDASFCDSQIRSLGNLEHIGRHANVYRSQITDLGNLKYIGGSAYFYEALITDLKNLEYIGNDLDIMHSKIISLGKLKTIGKDAYFCNTKITSLGELESIGKQAFFGESQITDLGKLKSIGFVARLKDSKLTPADFASIKVRQIAENL